MCWPPDFRKCAKYEKLVKYLPYCILHCAITTTYLHLISYHIPYILIKTIPFTYKNNILHIAFLFEISQLLYSIFIYFYKILYKTFYSINAIENVFHHSRVLRSYVLSQYELQLAIVTLWNTWRTLKKIFSHFEIIIALWNTCHTSK